MRKIVYFLPDKDAGVTRVVKNLLLYRPVNVHIQYVVVLLHQSDDNSNAYRRVSNDLKADEIIRFEYSSNENTYTICKRLHKILKSDEDIIVSNDGFELKMVVVCKLKNPVVYILHGDFDYYYNIIKFNQSVIDSIIAISGKMEQEVQKLLDVENKNKVCKIYYPAIVEHKLPQNNNRLSGAFKILFAGTLDERKGADVLFPIYDELMMLGVSNFSFQIIGDGVLFKQLSDQFRNRANVVLSGWASNNTVLKEMSKADVFLFPSTSEGLPNVLVEALSVGAVPVASNLESGVKDIIEEGMNGLLVNCGDVKGFANAIADLYNNREKLEYLRSNSNTGLEKFSPYIQAAKYQEKILEAGEISIPRKFPKQFSMGRVLNKSWLPNWFVKSVRSVIKHPKL